MRTAVDSNSGFFIKNGPELIVGIKQEETAGHLVKAVDSQYGEDDDQKVCADTKSSRPGMM